MALSTERENPPATLLDRPSARFFRAGTNLPRFLDFRGMVV